LNSAVLSEPKWRNPVGEGANRVLAGRGDEDLGALFGVEKFRRETSRDFHKRWILKGHRESNESMEEAPLVDANSRQKIMHNSRIDKMCKVGEVS
jgi:hypothetical protein